jgi:hypothetical protein
MADVTTLQSGDRAVPAKNDEAAPATADTALPAPSNQKPEARPSVVRKILLHAALTGALVFAVAGSEQVYSIDYAREHAQEALTTMLAKERRQFCLSAKSSDADKGQVGSQSAGARTSAMEFAETTLLPGLSKMAASEQERRRIADQALKAQRLQCMSADLFTLYFGNYYAAVVVSIVCGTIAAVALFFMGTNGWKNANPFVVNVFMTTAVLAAYFSSSQAVFQQPQMVNEYKALFLRYDGLIDAMATYAAIGVLPASCKPASVARVPGSTNAKPNSSGPEIEGIRKGSPAELIQCVDAFFATTDIPFRLDPSKMADYLAALRQGITPISGQ